MTPSTAHSRRYRCRGEPSDHDPTSELEPEDVLVAPWNGGQPYIVSERNVTELQNLPIDSVVGGVDGLGIASVSFSELFVLVDDDWEPVGVEAPAGWPTFVLGRLFVSPFDGVPWVYDSDSGEFVETGGPSANGQIHQASGYTALWWNPNGGVFVSGRSFEWHAVEFDPAAGVTGTFESAHVIDGFVVVTSRASGTPWASGPISVYAQRTG